MHNYHMTHKVFLACTIIGSTPSILGCLLCPSQQVQVKGTGAEETVVEVARIRTMRFI